MSFARVRAALVASAVLVTTVPFIANAVAPHLTCGPVQTGRWETIPVRPFQPVSGLSASDVVSGYAVDSRAPQYVAVTNGVRIQVSDSDGCGWSDAYALDPGVSSAQPFLGTDSSIVSLGLRRGQVLAAVQEGAGSASRPHVVRQVGGKWVVSDSGLPAQGSPRLLRVAPDGMTVYLTISPTATGGSDVVTSGPLPTLPPLPTVSLPGAPGGQSATGLLYASADGGATWTLRTGPDALPNGGTGFSSLAVDNGNPGLLYGIANGKLLVSRDAGATFTTAPGTGFTAVAPMYPGLVVAFTSEGQGLLSYNGGAGFFPFHAPKGITSAAWRGSDSGLMVESKGVLRHFEWATGASTLEPAKTKPRTGTLLGDDGVQSSFHAISGHALLRYVDPATKQGKYQTFAAGDASVTPPNPGTVTPGTRDVTLGIGKSAVEDFTLDLPKNPTPLDLYFLIDVSTSMSSYIDNLKQNMQKIVDRLTAAKINLRVGVATLGTAPAKGEPPYPDAYVNPPQPNTATGTFTPGATYVKPRIYRRIYPIGKTGAELRKAINSVQLETDPPVAQSTTYHEGQLLALEQSVTGSGVKSEQDDAAHANTYSAVAPGQDAGWRPNPDVRRMIVIASDEAFDAPYGTPQKPGSTVANPKLDFTRTLKILNDARVGVFGITAGSQDSVDDMDTLARGTHTFSPPGGVSCGGDPPEYLKKGAPLVCSQDGDFSTIIGQVLSELSDVQDVSLQPSANSPVLRALNAVNLRRLDVKRANRAGFSVNVSCKDVDPGTYAFDVNASLRGFPVGTAHLRVTCEGPPLPVPLPLVALPLLPPIAPAVQPPAPPPAPPPAAQPQPQPNVNPLAAGVTQEQQETQVAVAMNDFIDNQEAPEIGEQLAMVDRRKREQVQAFGSLLVALTVCSGLGLARLRTQTALRTRTSR